MLHCVIEHTLSCDHDRSKPGSVSGIQTSSCRRLVSTSGCCQTHCWAENWQLLKWSVCAWKRNEGKLRKVFSWSEVHIVPLCSSVVARLLLALTAFHGVFLLGGVPAKMVEAATGRHAERWFLQICAAAWRLEPVWVLSLIFVEMEPQPKKNTHKKNKNYLLMQTSGQGAHIQKLQSSSDWLQVRFLACDHFLHVFPFLSLSHCK